SLIGLPSTSVLGAKLTRNSDGTIGYDPTAAAQIQRLAEGQVVVDTFIYAITDEFGKNGSTATVSINLTGKNDKPVARADAATVTSPSAVNIAVLSNDTDPDNGAQLFVAELPAFSALGAQLSVNGDGSVRYDASTGALANLPKGQT